MSSKSNCPKTFRPTTPRSFMTINLHPIRPASIPDFQNVMKARFIATWTSDDKKLKINLPHHMDQLLRKLSIKISRRLEKSWPPFFSRLTTGSRPTVCSGPSVQICYSYNSLATTALCLIKIESDTSYRMDSLEYQTNTTNCGP